MIAIFRDMRPIKDLKDERLQKLQHVAEWFLTQKSFVKSDLAGVQKSAKGKKCYLSNAWEIYSPV